MPSNLFVIGFVFRSIIPKTQKYLAALFLLFILFRVLSRAIYPITTNLSIKLLQLSHVRLPISGAVTRKGLTIPLTLRVASICFLCAGTV